MRIKYLKTSNGQKRCNGYTRVIHTFNNNGADTCAQACTHARKYNAKKYGSNMAEDDRSREKKSNKHNAYFNVELSRSGFV